MWFRLVYNYFVICIYGQKRINALVADIYFYGFQLAEIDQYDIRCFVIQVWPVNCMRRDIYKPKMHV